MWDVTGHCFCINLCAFAQLKTKTPVCGCVSRRGLTQGALVTEITI